MSVAWPASARRWTVEEVVADSAQAVADFRLRRLVEPLHRYLAEFDAHHAENRKLTEGLGDVFGHGDGELLGKVLATEKGRTGFRYLGAPPISSDDLKTLAEAGLSAASVRDIAGKRQRLLAVMRAILDPAQGTLSKLKRRPC